MKNIKALLVTGLLCVFVMSGSTYAANYANMLSTPSAAEVLEGITIQASPGSGAAPLEVVFEPFFPEDIVRQGLEYEWLFGDGTSSVVRAPTHVYASPGVYTVTFKRAQQGSQGFISKSKKRIVVTNGVNVPPKIKISKLNASYAPGDVVVLNASASSDEDGMIRSYQWIQYAEEQSRHVQLNGAQSSSASFLMPEAATDGRVYLELRVEDNQGEVAYGMVVATMKDRVEVAAVNPYDFAPFETQFRLEMRSGKKIDAYQLDYEGDGIIDTNSIDADGFSYQFTRPGVYHPIATLIDETGVRYTGTTTIKVLSRETEEESIRKLYQLMSRAVLDDQIALSMQYFADDARPGIAGFLSMMDPAQRVEIFDREVKKVRIHEWYGGFARVQIIVENAGTQTIRMMIEMMRNPGGEWYITNFSPAFFEMIFNAPNH